MSHWRGGCASALCGALLVLFGVPATTSAAPPAATCGHTPPTSSAAASTLRAISADATGLPNGDALALSIQQVIAPKPAIPDGSTARSLPDGLSDGIIGVIGTSDTGFKVIVDPRVQNPSAFQSRLRAAAPAPLSSFVSVEASCVSATTLQNDWTKLTSMNWTGDASRASYLMTLDPESEQIHLNLGANMDGALVPVLRGLDPGVVVVDQGEFVQDTRTNDGASHWGGANISDNTWTCSSGFAIKRADGVVGSTTASHCDVSGTQWYSGSNYYGTANYRSEYPTYDVMMLTGSTYSPYIYTDGQDTVQDRYIMSAADPTVGQAICQSGAQSLSICSIIVQSLSAQYCNAGSCTSQLMTAQKGTGITVVRNGDSGGPIYTKSSTQPDGAVARATVVGGVIGPSGTQETLVGEKWSLVSNHLDNATVLTGP